MLTDEQLTAAVANSENKVIVAMAAELKAARATLTAVREACEWECKYGAVKFALPEKVITLLDNPPPI